MTTDIKERLRNAPTDPANKANDYKMQARFFHEVLARIEELEAENESMAERLSIARLRHRKGDIDGVWEALTDD